MYALLTSDGTIDRYPLSLTDLRRAFTQVNFALTPAAAELMPFGIVWVSAVEPPAYEPDSEALIEDTPQCVAGEWVQTWAVAAIPPEEVAARLQARRAGMTCTPRQARLALQQAGLLAAVTAWIAAADEATRIEWEFATEIRRDWPPIATCASALGLADTDLDGLFALAETL